MTDIRLERTEPTNPTNVNIDERGQLAIEEKYTSTPVISTPTDLRIGIPAPQRSSNRADTIEHLAARRPVTPLDIDEPDIKQQLTALRTEFTTLVTALRWGGASVQDTADSIIPLLNVGSVPQWAPVLVPFLLEIDRAGNLAPVWLNIIKRDLEQNLLLEVNPADTMIGRAKRYAILMLGNYKAPDISQELGKLAQYPNTSLYATQSLAKQGTTSALHALVSVLKEAEGWAKVDIVEACLTLNQPRFHELLLASGLDRVSGLESYIAIPIYRSIPLERYLRGGKGIAPRLTLQATLIFAQVLQDSMKPNPEVDALPIAFEQDIASLANALFEHARTTPNWQNVLAVHRLAMLIGRYWAEISQGNIQETNIIEPVYACLPLMPEIERWMNGPGRDVLLEALASADEEAAVPVMKVLAELREPRAIGLLLGLIDAATRVSTREQAIRIGTICDALGQLGDRRAAQPMMQLVERTVNITLRTARPKRHDNLANGDEDIPGSIVYGAAVRALGKLNDPAAFDFIARAANDFDPYVRLDVLEALRNLDPTGRDMRSTAVVREALNDPRDANARLACQMVAQYHDNSAIQALQHLTMTRPEIATAAADTLQQLDQ